MTSTENQSPDANGSDQPAELPELAEEDTLEPAVAEILARRNRQIGQTALEQPKRSHVASGPTYEYRRWI